MSKTNTLFKNTIFKSLLNVVNIVVPIIIGPYIMRLLDVQMYGTYNRVFSEFQVFLVFASFGVYTYGVREISKIRDNQEEVSKLFTNLFIISFITNILVLIVYILYAFLTSSGLALSIYLVFIIQIVANMFYVEFVNEALESYKFITIKSIVVKIIYLISIMLLIKNADDVIIYAVIVSLTNFLNNIISFIYAKSKLKFNFSNIEFKKYIKPLIAVLIISNVGLLYGQLDKIMLGRFVDEISVTVYYTAYYLISTLASIPYSIINVSIPRLSYVLKNEGKVKYEEKLSNSISSLMFIIVPMCFGVLVLAKEVIALYAGSKYTNIVVPLIISCIVKIFISLESVMNNLVMYPNNKENRILKVAAICGACNLCINFILVGLGVFNPSSAMATTGLAELAVFVIHYVYARKKMNIKVDIFNKKNVTYILLSLLFIPISLLIHSFNLPMFYTIVLTMISCMSLYYIVLLIKRDTNLMFILNKFFKKVKRY